MVFNALSARGNAISISVDHARNQHRSGVYGLDAAREFLISTTRLCRRATPFGRPDTMGRQRLEVTVADGGAIQIGAETTTWRSRAPGASISPR